MILFFRRSRSFGFVYLLIGQALLVSLSAVSQTLFSVLSICAIATMHPPSVRVIRFVELQDELVELKIVSYPFGKLQVRDTNDFEVNGLALGVLAGRLTAYCFAQFLASVAR
jgi:hypothetical protein